MRATRILPDSYQLRGSLNLSTPRAALLLNLGAIPLLFVFGWLFRIILERLVPPFSFPPGLLDFIFSFSGIKIIFLLLAIIIVLLLHELIHGLFFWLFTHSRPEFALKPGYAFAAAPSWFLPRWQYVIVGLSPLAIISIACILLAWVGPFTMVSFLLIAATFNAAGSLGDMIIVGWVICQPGLVYVKDEGDVFSLFSLVVSR